MSQAPCQCVTPQKISDDTTGEIICKNCGVILESHTVWHSNSNGQNTIQRHDYGIGTEYAKIKLSHRSSEKISRNETHQDKRIKELFMSVNTILQKISATHTIKEEAFNIARKCAIQNIVKGRRKTDVAVACVMVSCKIHGRSIHESEIIKISNTSKKSTRKAYRIILETFNVNTSNIHQRTIRLVNRICTDLGINQKIMLQSLELLEKIKHNDTGISSHPGTVAGTVVYMSCNGMVSQRKIASASGVTDVSLRNFCKKIVNKDLSETHKNHS